jgi:hypothetical protein
MHQTTIEKAILWYESVGYHAEKGYFGHLYLELDGFSVQLTNDEVEGRAQQWDMEQLREN